MKIGIYNQPYGGVGGSEFCAAVLAEAFSKQHEVTILHHIEPLTKERFEQFFSVTLGDTNLRYFPWEPFRGSQTRLPWRRYRESREFYQELSEPFDVFVAFVHQVPPFCHARRGVLVVLFPTFDRPNEWPWTDTDGGSWAWRMARRCYDDWEWRQRMASYPVKWAISQFTAAWTRRRWGIDCQVVAPPVEIDFPVVPKERLILSLGRFTPVKKQLEMLQAFRSQAETTLRGWKYYCVGGLSTSPLHQEYFGRLDEVAGQCGAILLPNASRETVCSLLQRAGIFWHAMGCGEDPEKQPQLMEHFGICTVEAMAAGCVPVVVNRGGQAEIVEPGVSGFVWETISEMLEYTARLVTEDGLRGKMSAAARGRAAQFDKQQFCDRFAAVLTSSPRWRS